MVRVVLDTNVVVAGLRSRNGTSAVLLALVAEGRVGLVLSAALLDEYEDVLQWPEHGRVHGLGNDDLMRFLRGLADAANFVPPRLERRLVLVRDPDDAAVAEAAIDGDADRLVTHNLPLRRGRWRRLGPDTGRAPQVAGRRATNVTTKAAYPLKMAVSLKQAAERLAAEDGVSLNQWINIAVAQKISAVETAERLRARYGKPQPDDLRSVLAKVPDVPPLPGDEIPDDHKAFFGRG